MPNRWMQKAQSNIKKGALRKKLGKKPGQKISTSKLVSLTRSGGRTAKQANLALNYRGYKGSRGGMKS